MPLTPIENKYTRLMSPEEHLQVFKLLGNRTQVRRLTITPKIP
jgi:hypothetical protein